MTGCSSASPRSTLVFSAMSGDCYRLLTFVWAKARPHSRSPGEHGAQAQPECLEGELLGDVDAQAPARVEHPLDRLPRPGRIEPPSGLRQLGAAVCVQDNVVR